MAERPGELNRTNEENFEKDKINDTGLKPRPATTADEINSELVVKDEIAKTENPPSETSAVEDPEQIKEQIEQTRSQMSETINAIEEKLSYDHISEQVSEHVNNAVETAKNAVYDAARKKVDKIMKNVNKGLNEVSETVGEAGTYAVQTARRNPLPLALIGLGIGMLLVQGSRSKTSYSGGGNQRGYRYGGSHREGESKLRHLAHTGTDALSSAQRKVGDAAGSVYEGAADYANSAYEGVSSAASSAYQGLTSAAGSAYQGVSSLAGSTGSQIQNAAHFAQDQYERTLEENPLALGAIALAVGAVAGLSIPITSYENQWMGETRESLVQTVEDSAREAMSKVQDSVGEALNNVREQAQSKANA